MTVTEWSLAITDTPMPITVDCQGITTQALIDGSKPHNIFGLRKAQRLLRGESACIVMPKNSVTNGTSNPDTAKSPKLILTKIGQMLDASLESQRKAFDEEVRSHLVRNAEELSRQKFFVITIARLTYAIHKGHNIRLKNEHGKYKTEISGQVLSHLIDKYFKVGSESRNILNFAHRDTDRPSDNVMLAGLIYIIHHYDSAILSKCDKPPRHIDELFREMNFRDIYVRLTTSSFDDFHRYMSEPNKTSDSAIILQAIKSNLHIKKDNAKLVKDILLGHANSREFFIYRDTTLSDHRALLCKVAISTEGSIYFDDELQFLSYKSYGHSDDEDTVESTGFVLPMQDAIYFIGARQDGSGLKIYAFPSHYHHVSVPVQSFNGILLSVDTAETKSKVVFSARVFAQHRPSNSKSKNQIYKSKIDPTIISSIRNNTQQEIGTPIRSSIGENSIDSLETLKFVLDSFINQNKSTWPIIDKDNNTVNPLSDNIIRSVGVLKAIPDWSFNTKASGVTRDEE